MQHRFVALDGIRGVAALAVAFFHLYWHWGGYLAVDLFFVLSGFVLSHAYFFAPHKPTMGAFVVQRLARLYPLHLFTLLTYVAAYVWVAGALPDYPDGTLYTFVQNLTLTNNVGLNPGGQTFNYASWSISVEFWLNIAFFALIPVILKTARLLALSFLCLAILMVWSPHIDVTYQNILGVFNAGLIRGVASFSLGIVAYKAYLALLPRMRHVAQGRGAMTLVELAVLGACLYVVFAREGKFSQLDFLAPVLFTVLIPVFALEKGALSALLGKLSVLGDMSYSIYLNHLTLLLVFKLFMVGVDPLITLVAYFGILLVYSHVTYTYIEGPARRAIRRLADRAAQGRVPHRGVAP